MVLGLGLSCLFSRCWGMVLRWIDRLKMSVRTLMATGLCCFRCLYEMPSGPAEEVGFVCYIVRFVMLWVKGGGGHFVGAACVVFCLFYCRRSRVVVWRGMRIVD